MLAPIRVLSRGQSLRKGNQRKGAKAQRRKGGSGFLRVFASLRSFFSWFSYGLFHAAEDAVGLGDGHSHDLVRPVLARGDGVDAKLGRVARRAHVGDVTVGEIDPEPVGLVRSLDGAESHLGSEESGELLLARGAREAIQDSLARPPGKLIDEAGLAEARGKSVEEVDE